MVYIAVDYMSMGYVLKESEMNLEEVCSVYTFRCRDVLIPFSKSLHLDNDNGCPLPLRIDCHCWTNLSSLLLDQYPV